MLDFFRKKNGSEDVNLFAHNTSSESASSGGNGLNTARPDIAKDTTESAHPLPEIPENIFVEYEKPNKPERMDPIEQPQEINDLHALYRYLDQNLEKNGYDDALTNPDTSYMQEKVEYLQNELHLLIAKAYTYYNDHLRKIDFHIETRKRHEMVETVDELLSHRASIEDELKQVESIDKDARAGNGITQNVILSYKRGFKKGFAAITYGTILNRNN